MFYLITLNEHKNFKIDNLRSLNLIYDSIAIFADQFEFV